MPMPLWSDNQVLDQLFTRYRWYTDVVTYDFPMRANEFLDIGAEATTFQTLNAQQRSMATLGMQIWDDLIAPSLEQTSLSANIKFGLSLTNTYYAHSYYPPNGSIWFNATDSMLLAPQIGRYSFETFLHEIGHTLGLDHMGNYNGAGIYQASCYQDSSVYSIMSYFGPEHRHGQGQVAWADWTSIDRQLYSPQTPMLNDVMAIQQMYGPDLTTRIGDTVYGFNINISGALSRLYDFTKNANPILTIYDAGGIDTLDFSGWNAPSAINLGAGKYSSCNEMTNNLAIAYDCLIENAIGGSGADMIEGNAVANRIWGMGGNDTILGGDGIDWSLYRGNFSDYLINASASSVTVSDKFAGRDGVDRLSEIERVSFKDINLDFDISGAAGQGYRLYKAAFDRTPDLEGLGYWIQEMDGGKPLVKIAESFVESTEFLAMYGAQTNEANFIKLLYQHVLHRDPDQSGYAYWLSDMAGGQTKASVLALFSESPENLSQTAELVANGIQYYPLGA